MSYDNVRDSVNEVIHDRVDEFVDEIVDEIMKDVLSADTFHIDASLAIEEVDVDDYFKEVVNWHEDDLDTACTEALSDETTYTDDCIDIITEYGLDDAVKDYYKERDLDSVEDVAYAILADHVWYDEPNMDDHYDSIYQEFYDRWNNYVSRYCFASLKDLIPALEGHGFTKIVYEDDSVRFYHPKTGTEFKISPQFELIAGTLRIPLGFIRDDEYNDRLVFYCMDQEIASEEY